MTLKTDGKVLKLTCPLPLPPSPLPKLTPQKNYVKKAIFVKVKCN